jgi:hypothetical protein
MQPRWHKESILLTCGGEIGSQRVGDDGLVWAGFNSDEVHYWWFSGPKGVRRSFLESSSSFFTDQLLQLVKKTSNLVVARDWWVSRLAAGNSC